MNQITHNLAKAYEPVAALIVYSMPNGYYGSNFMLETRGIGPDGMLGAAKPVTCDFIGRIAKSFTKSNAPKIPYGHIPDNMIYADNRPGHEKYIWWTRPGRQMMFFAKELNIESGLYHIPGLVFIAGKGGLSVFAHKEKKLKSDSLLYRAPFFNIYKEGKVCLGSGKKELPKDMTYRNLIQHWEALFWKTEFARVLGDNPTKSNLVLVTQRSTEAFNHSELIPVKKLTLENLMR